MLSLAWPANDNICDGNFQRKFYPPCKRNLQLRDNLDVADFTNFSRRGIEIEIKQNQIIKFYSDGKFEKKVLLTDEADFQLRQKVDEFNLSIET